MEVVVRTLYRSTLRRSREFAEVANFHGLSVGNELELLNAGLGRKLAQDAVSHGASRSATDGGVRVQEQLVRRMVASGYRSAAGTTGTEASERVRDGFAALGWLADRTAALRSLPASTSSWADSGQCRVSVQSRFHGRDRSGAYRFLYDVELQNVSKDRTFALVSRAWTIVDCVHGSERHVSGPGVIGQFPTLVPGQVFHYGSWVPLEGPLGSMRGSYQFVYPEGGSFEAQVAPFLLRAGANEADETGAAAAGTGAAESSGLGSGATQQPEEREQKS